MKYIVSGGGTGGHIYPALAIAKEISSRDKNAKILYVGTENSLEKELAEKENIEFAAIPSRGLPRKISADAIISVAEIFKGIIKSGKIIKKFNPDIVIGTGGYVCAPILFSAQQKRIPTLIQEQNAYPGKTNKMLAKKANLVALSFEEAKTYFPRKDNLVITGNPIRKEFMEMSLDSANENFGYDMSKDIVLSFGGSGGQESTNNTLLEILNSDKKIDFQLIHITGKKHHEDFMRRLKVKRENVEIFPYSHNIPQLLRLATLVIASSSAMTLAEISAVGVGSILIPKAYTAGNHQYFNALSYKDIGASNMILEKDLNAHVLLSEITNLLENKEMLKNMGNNAKSKGNLHAVKSIVDEIENIIRADKNG